MVTRLVHDNVEWISDDLAAYTIVDRGDGRLTVTSPEGTFDVFTASVGDTVWVGIDGEAIDFEIRTDESAQTSGGRDQDALMPPMSATVVRLQVKPGDRVSAGDTLVVLEAMKMELPIRAPRDGAVRAVHCAEGQLVHPGTALVEIE